MTVRRLKERADEVALRLRGDVFDARRVRVVAADAPVRAAPDELFAVNEDGINVIGTKPARRSFKRESFDEARRIVVMKHAASIRADPHILMRARTQGQHHAETRSRFHRAQSIAGLVKPAVVGFGLRAVPEPTASIQLKRIDKESARRALYLADHIVLNRKHSATARSRVEDAVFHRQTGQVERARTIKVCAGQRLFGDGLNAERLVRVGAAIEDDALKAGEDCAPALPGDDAGDGAACRLFEGAKLTID